MWLEYAGTSIPTITNGVKRKYRKKNNLDESAE